MAFDSLLNFFKLPPEEEYDDDEYDIDDRYQSYEEPAYEEPVVRKKPIARPRPVAEEKDEEPKKTGFLGSKPKVVPMNREVAQCRLVLLNRQHLKIPRRFVIRFCPAIPLLLI